MNEITTFGEATMASLAGAMALMFAAVPKIIGFVLILFIGWFVASLIGKAVATLLRAVKFNELAQRAGLTGFVNKMGIETDASGFLANLAKWFIRLIVMVVAFDALGLPAVSDVLRQLLLWLPNLVVAMVVLVVAGLVADALANLVRAATAQGGFSNPELLARIAKTAVWTFAIIIAVNQLGIAATLVNTLFMASVGAIALAAGLAFGLGGRETASELLRDLKTNVHEAKPNFARAADAAEDQASAIAASMSGSTTAGTVPRRRM